MSLPLSTVGRRAFPVASLERPARGRHLIVITAVFPASTKDSIFFQLSHQHLILWLLVMHRYSGPCSNIVIEPTLKIYVYLLTYSVDESIMF